MIDFIFRISTVLPFVLMAVWSGYSKQWRDMQVSVAIAVLNWLIYFK